MRNDRHELTDALARFHRYTDEMVEGAQRWLRDATTKREKEFASTLLRHARGAQLAASAGQQDLKHQTT